MVADIKTFSGRILPSGAAFDDARIDEDLRDALRRGERVGSAWPADGVSLSMRPPRSSKKLNPVMLCGGSFTLLRDDLARRLANEPFAECLPVILCDHAGKEVSRDYVLLNALKVDCLDHDATEGTRNAFDDTFDEITSYAFKLDALGEADVFRAQGLNKSVVFVRGELAEHLSGLPSAYLGDLGEDD
jgi:hypothetical protein